MPRYFVGTCCFNSSFQLRTTDWSDEWSDVGLDHENTAAVRHDVVRGSDAVSAAREKLPLNSGGSIDVTRWLSGDHTGN